LRFDSLAVGVLHLDNFTDGVGELDYLGVGVPPRKHEMHLGRLPPDDLKHLVQVDELQAKGVV